VNLARMQAMGQLVSEADFVTMLLAGTHVVLTIKQTASVASCAVPPGGPSMVDTNLKGLKEMGRLLHFCGPDWWVLPSPHELAVMMSLRSVNDSLPMTLLQQTLYWHYRPEVCIDKKLVNFLVSTLVFATELADKAKVCRSELACSQ
jgi:hypothetical protein